ncbi:MAG: sugar nucleotide-binding protein [Betaproteobacteria bacterium]|nr:sugar nucleotide-binding protein [Betaproteobacteria bacterium]
MRVLVLGASGMLGNAVMRLFAQSPKFAVWGSTRSSASHRYFPEQLRSNLITNVDVEKFDALSGLFGQVRPDAVINCVGLVKQLAESNDALAAISLNAVLPHRLVRLCRLAGARLVHISTDCVFDGSRGGYVENDRPDAYDLYGRSKLLGEVDDENAITLRTSIIGRELSSARGLIDWFLSQEHRIKGYSRAVFSGLPTMELARVIRDFVLPHPELHGLYHVSAEPISKYDLLTIVAKVYGKSIDIVPDDELVIDRSLNSDRFRAATGYVAPGWHDLVRAMRDFG